MEKRGTTRKTEGKGIKDRHQGGGGKKKGVERTKGGGTPKVSEHRNFHGGRKEEGINLNL